MYKGIEEGSKYLECNTNSLDFSFLDKSELDSLEEKTSSYDNIKRENYKNSSLDELLTMGSTNMITFLGKIRY